MIQSRTLVAKLMLALTVLVALPRVASADPKQAEANASASIKIKAKIQLTKTKDLAFVDAYQGSNSIPVAASESGAAQFKAKGHKGDSFIVSFPSSSVFMTTGSGATAQEKIAVSSFTTDLASNTGVLDASTGEKVFNVGASHAAILDDQVVADDYVGQFTVRVTYQ